MTLIPRDFAFIRQEVVVDGQTQKRCVMVTAPASNLIEPITDRMPAILEDDDWSIWLGEESTKLDEVKAVLKTMENVRWTIAPEPKEKNTTRAKPKAEKPEPEQELF